MEVASTKLGSVTHYHAVGKDRGRHLLKALRHDVRLGERIFFIHFSESSKTDIEVHYHDYENEVYSLYLCNERHSFKYVEDVVNFCEKAKKLIAFI